MSRVSREDYDVRCEAWALQTRAQDVRCWLHLAAEETEIAPNWETFDVLPEEFQMAGERMLVFGRWRARGRTSGVELDAPGTWLVERSVTRKIGWLQTYTDRDEALKDAGLSAA